MKYQYILAALFFQYCYAYSQERTLDYYIDRGIKSSPLLIDYKYQIASNNVDSSKVKAAFRPQVGLNGQLYYAPNINGYGYDVAATNNGNIQFQLGVSQQLITKKPKEAQWENISILNRYLTNNSEISVLDLRKAITGQYITAYKDFALIKSEQEVLKLLGDEEELMKPLVQRGIYSQTDFLNIRLVKENQLLNLRQTQMSYQNDLYELNVICGIEDTIADTLQRPELILRNDFDPANSILLQRYRIDSLKFNNRKKLFDLNYQPKLSLFADAGLWSTNPLAVYKNFGAGVGLNFNMPIYDGHLRKFEQQKIILEAQISHVYETFYKRQYQQQVQQLRAQLKATDELLAETDAQMQLAQSAIDAYKAQLNMGLVKVTDLVLAINNYINFKTSLEQVTISRLQIINQINYFK